MANPPEALCGYSPRLCCEQKQSRAGKGVWRVSVLAPLPWLVSLVLATPWCGRYLKGSRRRL